MKKKKKEDSEGETKNSEGAVKYSQILKLIKKLPIYSWMDFRIVMDQGLFSAPHCPPF